MSGEKKQSVRIPLPFGGVYGAGSLSVAQLLDPATIPEGKSYDVSNFVRRPGRWQTAAQWAATSLTTGIKSIFRWEDLTNNATRLVAFKINGGNLDLYLQNSNDDTFAGSAAASVVETSISDSCNFHGRLFAAGATAIYGFDGSTAITNAIGGETLVADTLATFIERIFFGRLHVSIANKLTVAQSYDPTSSWATSNITAEKVTNGSTIVGRITPTNDTTASLYLKDVYTVAAATSDTFLRYWCDLRNTSAVYAVPVKIEAYYSQAWVAGATYAVGHIRVPTAAIGNGYRYRVTAITTGVAAGVEPTWPTTVGTTVVDGGVTWICDGTDACGSLETTIDNTSNEPNFTRNSVLARVAPNPQSTKIGIRIVYGNTDNATFTLTSLEMSLRDGKTDGDLAKENRGQQLTVGRFGYDFFNQESSATATVIHDDRIYWTETADSNDIRGNNFYRCQELAGRITAIRSVGGRLVAFKARGMWVFQGTADPDNPIRLEKFYATVGCNGPIAIDAIDDTIYFIGKSEVYSWTPGSDPRSFAGDAMRETLFATTAISNSKVVTPSYLVTAHSVKELWLATGGTILTPRISIYSIPYDEWTQRTLFPSGASTSGVVYSPSTYVLYGWNSGGAVYTHTGETVGDPSSTFLANWTPRHINAPPGYSLRVKNVWLRYIRPIGACTLSMSVTYVVNGTSVTYAPAAFSLLQNDGQASILVALPVFAMGDRFEFTFTFRPGDTDSLFAVVSCEAECDLIPTIPSTRVS